MLTGRGSCLDTFPVQQRRQLKARSLKSQTTAAISQSETFVEAILRCIAMSDPGGVSIADGSLVCVPKDFGVRRASTEGVSVNQISNFLGIQRKRLFRALNGMEKVGDNNRSFSVYGKAN